MPTKAQIDAAAEVLCDASGWALKECRYLAKKMIEQSDQALADQTCPKPSTELPSAKGTTDGA
jgi:hypothetical protein